MKHLKKVHTDVSEWSSDVVSKLTGTPLPTGVYEGFLARQAAKSNKNPAAVALGKLGGKKGGAARAKALTKKERSEIATKAAKARWSLAGKIKAAYAKGYTAKEVAERLGISIEAAKAQKQRFGRVKPEPREKTLKALH